MRSGKIATDHFFFCTRCGCKGIPVCREKRHLKEAGHLKVLYCLNCNVETNHVECIPGSKYSVADFRLEYQSDNFTENGVRKMSISELRKIYGQMFQQYNEEFSKDEKTSCQICS